MQFLAVLGVVFGILCLIWTFISFLWPLMGWYNIKEGGPNENIGNLSQVAPIVSSSQSELPPIPNSHQTKVDGMPPIPVGYSSGAYYPPNNMVEVNTDDNQPNFFKRYWQIITIVAGILIIGLISILLIFFKDGNDGISSGDDDLQFSTYRRQENAQAPDGPISTIIIGMDIPKGEGKQALAVIEIIKNLINESEIAKEIGEPIDGSLYEICEDYLKKIQKGISNGELNAPLTYLLEIQHIDHSADYVAFRVANGIFGNGGSYERYAVFRLSDQHEMDQHEMYRMSDYDLKKLIYKYEDDEYKDYIQSTPQVEAEIVPVQGQCCIHYAAGGVTLYRDVYIPMSELEPYLTEEGRKVFKQDETADADDNEEETLSEDTSPGRGELGIFDLRGPVKSVTWKYSYGVETYTFDKRGFWLTLNGNGLDSRFPGGIERYDNKRIKYGNADAYGSVEYIYNDQGLATGIYEDGFSRDLTYDSDGYVKKEVQFTAPDMGDEESDGETRIVTFTILEKDAVGNWTKRRVSDGFVETRKITYY